MKLYYRAVNQDGSTVTGLIEARDEKEVVGYLRSRQLIPVKIIPAANRSILHYIPFLNRPTFNEKVVFTRQLSSMLASGLTLMQALEILKNQMQTPALEEMNQSLITEIQNGKPFSAAITKHPKFFSPVYVALIKTAESSGLLDKVLQRIAENLEKEQELKSSIRNALMYPVIVVVVMIIVLVIMMIFVIPQLFELYGSLDIDLPLSTRIIIGMSDFFKNYLLIILIVVAASGFYIRSWYKKSDGRRTVDKYMLKIPVVGKLIKEMMMAEFTRTLGLLIGAGSLVVESLIKSSEVVGNVVYRDEILLLSKRVEKGISIGDAMDATPLFPPIVIEMAKIGEQTGKLDESLLKASEYFEREVQQTVKTLTTLMEPAIMVILALAVAFLIFAVITPIYGLISSIN